MLDVVKVSVEEFVKEVGALCDDATLTDIQLAARVSVYMEGLSYLNPEGMKAWSTDPAIRALRDRFEPRIRPVMILRDKAPGNRGNPAVLEEYKRFRATRR
jgi:hypothetical protein